MPQPNKTEKFIWGAYHFGAERWTDLVNTTRVSIAPLGDPNHPMATVWDHDGRVEIHTDNRAPTFFVEAMRQWVKSDIKESLSLETFLMEMFP